MPWPWRLRVSDESDNQPSEPILLGEEDMVHIGNLLGVLRKQEDMHGKSALGVCLDLPPTIGLYSVEGELLIGWAECRQGIWGFRAATADEIATYEPRGEYETDTGSDHHVDSSERATNSLW